ncbi:hypothetical protein [Aeromonas veronii]|uniref:hypothetical protein n=1 Tax=Aeromonas veronii TaxID=654 RepID=UPI00301DCD8D
MKINSITIDACVWINYLDKKPNFVDSIQRMFDVCLEKNIKMFSSSRVFNYDTTIQDREQVDEIRKIMDRLGVENTPSPFSFGFSNDPKNVGSAFNDGDFFSINGSSEDELIFQDVVGQRPQSFVQYGKNLANHISDYDALEQHYLQGYDAFITYDMKGVFHVKKREDYKKKLNLNVLSPDELLNLICNSVN